MTATLGTLRADHIGSFLRPPELLEAHERLVDGEVTREEIKPIQDRAILDVLKFQQEVGLPIYTDGEYRRSSYIAGLSSTLEGFSPDPNPLASTWKNENRPAGLQVVSGKVRQTRRATEDEIPFLKEHSPGPFKITVPTISQFCSTLWGYRVGISDAVYPTRADFLDEMVEIGRNELAYIAGEGVPYIQLDATCYIDFCDAQRRGQLQELLGENDLDKLLQERVDIDNACIEVARSNGATIAVHLCRGNAAGAFRGVGGYEPIAEKVFNEMDADVFLLEYDSDRAGDFEPLRFLPKDKIAVLGLITTKSGELESKEEIIQRIEEASQYAPLENLAISPQCGFASAYRGNQITWEEQRRKLELVLDVARTVWG